MPRSCTGTDGKPSPLKPMKTGRQSCITQMGSSRMPITKPTPTTECKKRLLSSSTLSKHVYLVAVDVSNELVNDGGQGHVCGIGGGSWHPSNNETWQRNSGGLAVIPASGDCFTVGVTAHELGHAFSLEHDFRDDTYLMAYGSQSRLSRRCRGVAIRPPIFQHPSGWLQPSHEF